jgi:SNF2 family DNA or RNA helicase
MNYLVDYCQEQVDKNSPLLILSTRSETFLEPLAKILTKKKVKFGLITGKLNHTKKEAVIQKFQTGKIKILLANIQCAGLGLNLSQADTAIFADRSYSPADNEQAEARFLPVSQEESPRIRLVIDLVCYKTIDEKINKLLKRKENLIKVLNERPESIFGKF